MKQTKEGYYLPENDAETAAAIEHNTILAGSKGLATHEELMKRAKLNKPKTVLTIQNYMQNVEIFHETQPFFYDRTQIFWFWNNQEYTWQRIDDTELMDFLDRELELNGQTVTGGIKNSYVEAFKRIGRRHMPKEVPNTWIQFRNKIVDIKENKVFDASPEFFMCNPIPWTVGDSDQTPVMDKLFTEWVGFENKEALYEIIAYCTLPDYPIHSLFAFVGCGRNGKSKFFGIIEKFIGSANIVSTELDDLLENRFEKAKLYKKLVCMMGETNFGSINKTSLLKKLTGQDLIGMEFKNKNPFDAHSYAKILISSNSLPISNDTSEGFYRRWMILDFPNTFAEGKDILKFIPEEEYNNLARKSISILQKILLEGRFTHQGSIEQRKDNYIKASNPFVLFLQSHCDIREDYFEKSKDLYTAYVKYLLNNKKRVVKKKEFNQILSEEGFYPEKKEKKIGEEWQSSYWIEGLRLKKVSDNSDNSDSFLTQLRVYGKRVENLVELSEKSETFEQLTNILIDKPTLEAEIDSLVRLGFTEEQLNQWKAQGLIIEAKAGRVRLL